MITDRRYFWAVQMPVTVFVGILGGAYAVDKVVDVARYTGALPAQSADVLKSDTLRPSRLAEVTHGK